MPQEIPPLIAKIIADITSYLAGIEEITSATLDFAADLETIGALVDEVWANMAGGADRAAAATVAAGDRMVASASEDVAANERLVASWTEVAEAAERAAAVVAGAEGSESGGGGAVVAENEREAASYTQVGEAAERAAAVASAAMAGLADAGSAVIAENARVAASYAQIGEGAEAAAAAAAAAQDRQATSGAAIIAANAEVAASYARTGEAASAGADVAVGASGRAATAAEGAAARSATAGADTGRAWAAVGLGFVALGVEAIHAGADFETATTRLVTSAGEIAGPMNSNINMVRQGMLQLGADTGTATKEVEDGMYTVESAGYHGADGLNVLKAALQGAKQEGASVKTVADAVSTALTDYHLPASQAANVTSQLVAAVGQGKTTMESFSGALTNITPLASSLHIPLADVTGTLAEMTAHGMDASRAAQNLADTLRHLQSPTAQQRAELAQLGYAGNDLANSLGSRGLGATISDLSERILTNMGPSGHMLLDTFNQSKDAAANFTQAVAQAPAPGAGARAEARRRDDLPR